MSTPNRGFRKTVWGVIHADNDRLYDLLDKDFEATTNDDVEEAIDILEGEGSFAFARERMHSLVDEALDATDGLPESDQTARLRELARFLVHRDS